MGPAFAGTTKEKGRAPQRPPLFYIRECKPYFVTWPRISPPGLAAVWMLT
jgi:hypothetical protein